jgi:transposase-like protein
MVMARKRHTAEEIVNKLRRADVELSKGASVAQACKQIGVTEQTYYRWRREYGGMKVGQAKRLKDLEKENTRLKKLLAEAHLDKAMLQEVARGNF